MKKITPEERIRLVPIHSKIGSSPIRKHAFSLEVGEAIFLPKKEWKSYKYSPKTTIGSLLYHKDKKFTAKQHTLDKVLGYCIERRS